VIPKDKLSNSVKHNCLVNPTLVSSDVCLLVSKFWVLFPSLEGESMFSFDKGKDSSEEG
jgi:hypothetical protein